MYFLCFKLVTLLGVEYEEGIKAQRKRIQTKARIKSKMSGN